MDINTYEIICNRVKLVAKEFDYEVSSKKLISIIDD